ncbi:MAG: right-handed parallel beta-helix repeat-containing protein [Victivallaceae bacterium]|nr:right-handed parallel beta-helix repeat-containing protein [Victivallaceae bacterium]
MKNQIKVYNVLKHIFSLAVMFYLLGAMTPATWAQTIIYIDPINGNDAWAGTLSAPASNNSNGPWKSFTNLADVSRWDEARLIRDRTFYINSRVIIKNAENKLITADITAGSMPRIKSYRTITNESDWTQLPGKNIWVKDFGTHYWNPPFVLGLSTIGNYGKRVMYIDRNSGALTGIELAANKEWDMLVGTTTDSTKLYVYSTVNPAKSPSEGGYGTIYYQSGQQPVFRFEGARNVTISNLNFIYGYTPVDCFPGTAWNDNSIKVENCLIEDQYFGLKIAGSGVYGAIEFANNDIYRSRGAGIHVMRVKSADIYGNTINQACLSDSTGGIYCADISDTTISSIVKIHDNDVSRVQFGNYWISDGGGIYFDHDSSNGAVYRNKVHACYLALQCNSAGDNLKYYNNRVTYCDVGFIASDSDYYNVPGHISNVDVEIYNNTFATIGELQDPGQTYRPYVISLTGFKASGTMFVIKNNIIHASGLNPSDFDGIKLRAGNQYIEANNCYTNVRYPNIDALTGSELTIDSSSMVAYPQFDWSNYSLLPGSPCIDNGISGNLSFADNKDFLCNSRITGSVIDIGAMEEADRLTIQDVQVPIKDNIKGNIYDADITSEWNNGGTINDGWFTLDLGTVKTISKIFYKDDYSRPLEISIVGIGIVFDGTTDSGGGYTEINISPAVSGRYITFTLKSGSWLVPEDIRIYGQ